MTTSKKPFRPSAFRHLKSPSRNSRRGLFLERLEDRSLMAVVSHWTGDNTALDSVGNNHGTLIGGATYAAGQVGQAFSLDGVNDRVQVADSPSLALTQSMTIEAWVKANAQPTEQAEIFFRGDDRGGLDPYSLSLQSSGVLRWQVVSGPDAAEVWASMPLGQLVHVAATLDDVTGALKLYVNGGLASQTTTSVRPFADLDPASNPGIGIGNHGGFPATPHNFPWNGLIDELKVYDHALTAEEVQSHFFADGGQLNISIGDATATEGCSGTKFLDAFVPTASGSVVTPRGVVFGPDGNFYVGHFNGGNAGTVLRYDGQTGQFMDVFADAGIAPKQTTQVMFHGAHMFVSAGTHIFRFDAATGAAAPGAGQVGAEFITPADAEETNGLHGIAIGPDGHLYVASNVTHRVLKFDGSTGAFLGVYVSAGAGGLTGPPALTFGADGRLYVGSSGSVLRYRGPLESSPGAFIDAFVPSGSGGLSSISGDGLHFGPDGDLYVNTSLGNSVLRYNGSTGAFVETVVSPGEGGLSRTGGLTFDSVGRLYVASQNTHSVLRYGGESLAAFTVTLSAPSSLPVSVNYSTSSGTATAGVDFTGTSGTITFAPGQTSRTILLQTLDDAVYEGNETFVVNLTNPVGGVITDSQGVGTIVDNDPQPTKFYVVDDATANKTFEYGASGTAIENYAVNAGNSAPRGAASTVAGDKVWVVDANKKVFVYNNAGGLLGSWTAGSLAANADVQGVAVSGTDVWIVDDKQDKVFKYTGAATRLSGSQNAASSFNLASGNGAPTDIVTDGASFWVLNDAANDKVFKYTLAGAALGNWTLTGGGGSPTGITLDPASPSHLWIVDSGTDRVYQFNNAVGRTSGSQAAASSFALAAGNSNPQGIADPPVARGQEPGVRSQESRSATEGAGYSDLAIDRALLDVIDELGLLMFGSPKKRR